MIVASVPDEQWASAVGPVRGVQLMAWDVDSRPAGLSDVQFVVPPYLEGVDRLVNLAHAPRLEVVQLLSAGFDDVLAHLPAGVRLCNAAGVHDASTAELVVALTLASLRGVPEFVVAQREGRWLATRMWSALADKRVLVIGYGQVGRAIAARFAPFEVALTAAASRPRSGDELVPQVHGIPELPELLPSHEVVVLAVPLTEATTRLVDRDFLAAMPDGALLVNVARGKVVDTDALLEQLRSGRLHAALDVTDPEPLPLQHPLWSAPGVLISPHVGGASSAFFPRAVRLLREQLEAYAAGQPLANVVSG